MKTEVCCLPRVSEPVAIFKPFFIPVCKFRGTEWEPALHTACESGWRAPCADVCTGSSEQLFPVCKGSFPTWQHQFPAEIWWAGLGFACNAHEFTFVGKLEQLSHLMRDWGPFWAHTNLQQHHLAGGIPAGWLRERARRVRDLRQPNDVRGNRSSGHGKNLLLLPFAECFRWSSLVFQGMGAFLLWAASYAPAASDLNAKNPFQ